MSARTRRSITFFWTALFLCSLLMQYANFVAPPAAIAADGDPVVTQEEGIEGCMGVRTTPGSENTDKQLIGGTLEPGGTASFLISYPVDPDDVAGRETFVITDCVFIAGEPVVKYSVSFVPNTENFVLSFTLDIPEDAPIGAEYCNYAKTTAAPSESQASNRKAGPACFIIGGSLRVEKVDEAGDPLADADFDISCTFPTTTSFLADTIINAGGQTYTFESTSGGTITQSVTTGTDGVISVQAPVGTECTFTETAAPTGYILPDDADCTITVTLGEQQTCTFVNLQPAVTTIATQVMNTNGAAADTPIANGGHTSIGTVAYDTATLSGQRATAGGTVTYYVEFGDDECSTAGATNLGTKTVTNGVVPNSDTVTLTDAGTYYFWAVYSGDANNAGSTSPCDSELVVVTAPDLDVTKLVATNDGTFGPTSTAEPGDVLTFQITITNTGDASAATDVVVSDDIADLLAHATYNDDCSDSCTLDGTTLEWTIPSIAANGGTEVLTFSVTLDESFPEGTTNLPNVVVVVGPGSNCPEASTDPDCDTNTTVDIHNLTVDKSYTGNTGGTGPGGVPESKVGDVLTYTLTYDLTNGPVNNGVITDVLPVGLAYVAGSATGNAEFTFDSFDAATRTLTWTAPVVTTDGSVTYRVVVLAGAEELPQPLINVATIDSDETGPDDDEERVFVEVPPLPATGTPPPSATQRPNITPPPTNTITGGESGTANPGFALMVVLLGLAVFALVLGYITPVPARARRRDRR